MAAMSAVWEDERVAAGLARQLLDLREAERAGARLVGWKLGLGGPAAQRQAGIVGPVVGFLTSRTVVPDGADVSIAGWTRPVLEPELAVWLGEDVPAGASPAEAARCIAGVGLAIELADLDRPLDAVEEVVADNVFHRRVILGRPVAAYAGGDVDGVSVLVTRDAAEVARTDRPTELTGELPALTAHVAGWLEGAGRRLQAGQVVIAGSVVPLLAADPGARYAYRADPLGELTVHLT